MSLLQFNMQDLQKFIEDWDVIRGKGWIFWKRTRKKTKDSLHFRGSAAGFQLSAFGSFASSFILPVHLLRCQTFRPFQRGGAVTFKHCGFGVILKQQALEPTMSQRSRVISMQTNLGLFSNFSFPHFLQPARMKWAWLRNLQEDIPFKHLPIASTSIWGFHRLRTTLPRFSTSPAFHQCLKRSWLYSNTPLPKFLRVAFHTLPQQHAPFWYFHPHMALPSHELVSKRNLPPVSIWSWLWLYNTVAHVF